MDFEITKIDNIACKKIIENLAHLRIQEKII
jgi:hypothetical protein